MPKPKAVIFDIGNVLIHWQPERFYDAVCGALRRRKLFETVDLHAMNDKIDRGADFKATVYQTAEENPAFAPEIRLWHDRWIEIASPSINPSVKAAQDLHDQGIRTMILSNIGRETYDIAARHYAFLHDFDDHFISGDLGTIKPEPRIFEIVEQETGIAPDRLFFIDDRSENVSSARERRWQAHQFEGFAGLQRALGAVGLTV